MNKFVNLDYIQISANDDIKPILLKNMNENDYLYITYKKKICDCPLCNQCYKNKTIITSLKDLKIEYESEYKINIILKDLKCINQM